MLYLTCQTKKLSKKKSLADKCLKLVKRYYKTYCEFYKTEDKNSNLFNLKYKKCSSIGVQKHIEEINLII